MDERSGGGGGKPTGDAEIDDYWQERQGKRR